MENYLDKIKPNVGDAWKTDELFLKVKGDMKYLYALMDDETRLWIAQQVADTKYTANINPLFKQGKQVTGKRPNTLISDGAPNFNDSLFPDEKGCSNLKNPSNDNMTFMYIDKY
jgi:putative transposase